MKFILKQSGFTLIELLLYVVVAAVILSAISLFIALVLEARVHNQVITEVEEQGRQAVQVVAQTLRNAESISDPPVGSVGISLAARLSDGANSPTVFTVNNGVLFVKEGARATIPLTNSRVIVTNLTFRNLSLPNTPGTVRFQFTLTHVNPDGRMEYNYAQIFRGSATIRK